MKDLIRRSYSRLFAFSFCLIFILGNSSAFAGDNAALISVSLPAGTTVMPRTTFTQTWTVQNTGSTVWKATGDGYTLNLVGTDTMGAIPVFTNTDSAIYEPRCIIASGAPISTNGTAQFTMSFIAPEVPGTLTDTFQLNNTAGTFFGPLLTVQVTVAKAGSTNQYDRGRAISYANNYAGHVVSDGYFWTNGSDYYDFGAGTAVPTNYLGDDCAHFISSCIGSQPGTNRGGGLKIPTRVPPTYGEPGVARLVNTCLIGPGYAQEVFSLSELEPGDVIAWNWEGDTNIADLDHATLYLGNGLLASHSASCLGEAPSFFQDSLPDWRWHLIHIFDAPTIASRTVGNNFVLTWGTNWTGYTLYCSSSLATNATWTKITKTPSIVGASNVITNAMTSTLFYRLVLP